MEEWVNLGVVWKSRLVPHLSNVLKDGVGSIKLYDKLLMEIGFEGCLFIRLESKKHLIPNFKAVLGQMSTNLLFHFVLSQNRIVSFRMQRMFALVKSVLSTTWT